MRAFVDTNVWAYTYDRAEPVKRELAVDFFRNGSNRWVVSTQVLQELFNVLTRTLRTPWTYEEGRVAVDRVSRFEVVGSDAGLVHRAIQSVGDHQLSIWDALIVEAAIRGRCDVLYTEDLNVGASIRGVEIVNPFA